MRSPSLAPAFDEAVHLVLCDFGKQGLAYVETEPLTTEQNVVSNMLAGQYTHPVQVLAFNVAEGWSRDVSEDIAHEVLERARQENRIIPAGTQEFLEDLLDEELEPELSA
jgi:hypothetical protein